LPEQAAGKLRRSPRNAPQGHATPARRESLRDVDAADFDIGAWVRESRVRQGLPAKVEDDELLARVARFLLVSN
jgi:hypothetical protein